MNLREMIKRKSGLILRVSALILIACTLHCCSAKPESAAKTAELSYVTDLDAGGALSAAPLITEIEGSTLIIAATNEGTISAWRLEDMRQLWRIQSEAAFEASAAAVNGIVYLASLEGDIFAIDARQGRIINKKSGFGQIKGGLSVDPDSSALYAGSYDNHLYKIDIKTLSALWSYPAANFINGRAVASEKGVVFGSCDSMIYRIDRKDGSLLAQEKSSSYIPSTPAVDKDGNVYFAAYEGELGAWSADGALLWRYLPDRASLVRSPVSLAGKLVIFSDQRGIVRAVDKVSGKSEWEFDAGTAVDFEAVETAAGIVTVSSDGTLFVLDSASGRQISTYPLGALPTLGGALHKKWFAAGTSAGRLYLFKIE